MQVFNYFKGSIARSYFGDGLPVADFDAASLMRSSQLFTNDFILLNIPSISEILLATSTGALTTFVLTPI